MKVKIFWISYILRRIWLFSASSESFSKQPTQLIIDLNSPLRHIIVTNAFSRKKITIFLIFRLCCNQWLAQFVRLCCLGWGQTRFNWCCCHEPWNWKSCQSNENQRNLFNSSHQRLWRSWSLATVSKYFYTKGQKISEYKYEAVLRVWG